MKYSIYACTRTYSIKGGREILNSESRGEIVVDRTDLKDGDIVDKKENFVTRVFRTSSITY
jgi:hypothetical protein